MIQPVFALVLVVLSLVLSVRAEAARYPYQSCFEIASRLHDVPLDVLLAVAATESAWNPDARSHANAHGIMQIQWPGTARHLGVTRVSELYNPCLNIDLGARYLRELLDRSDGDLDRALAAYNYGPGRIEGVAVLPAGASRYVETVAGHRNRIASAAAGAAAPAAQPARAGRAELVRFDHRARARRYTETLNRQVSSARFDYAEADDGFVVTMRVIGQGLSFADRVLLANLGWPGAAP
jgi:soluble lytic murein transglycosylase-like protein